MYLMSTNCFLTHKLWSNGHYIDIWVSAALRSSLKWSIIVIIWSKLIQELSCSWRAVITCIWHSGELACSYCSCLLFTSFDFNSSLMVLLNSLSSLLVDRRADGPLTFCCFELVPVWLQEETSGSETDMKSLTLVLEKVGKEPIDWWVECLHLALLLVVMEGDDEWGTTEEDERRRSLGPQ